MTQLSPDPRADVRRAHSRLAGRSAADSGPAGPTLAVAAEMRRRTTAEGDLALVFCGEDGLPLLTLDLDEGTRHVDELFLRHVVTVVADLALPAVVVAVVRAQGRPARVDRVLWHELRARLDGGGSRLLDLVVVGASRSWSAAARSSAPRSSPARPSAARSGQPVPAQRPARAGT